MRKILIVDDDKDIIDFLSRFLESEGHKVLSAKNGQMALDKLKTQKFDTMLLDLKMPGVSGIDVLQKTKNMDMNSAIVVITGEKSYAKNIVKNEQILDIIFKPFKINKLRKSLKKAFREYDKARRKKR
jgi:DNA-binding response OmpR family regulator